VLILLKSANLNRIQGIAWKKIVGTRELAQTYNWARNKK
jgi:hypothetical protein